MWITVVISYTYMYREKSKKGVPLLNEMRFTRIHKKWLVVVDRRMATSRYPERERRKASIRKR